MESNGARNGKRKAEEPERSSNLPTNGATEAQEPYEPPMEITSTEQRAFEEIENELQIPARPWFILHLTRDVEDINLRQAVNIIYETSGDAYRASSIGWDASRKWEEMCQEGMRMIAMVQELEEMPANGGQEPPIWMRAVSEAEEDNVSGYAFLGMLNYLPVIEEDPDAEPTSFSALYIYEFHMIPAFQSAGYGSRLMEVIEEVAKAMEQKKLMLTVFASNRRGIAFYERHGFSKWDEEVVEQPKRRRLRSGIRGTDVRREPSYIIMAKDLDYSPPSGLTTPEPQAANDTSGTEP